MVCAHKINRKQLLKWNTDCLVGSLPLAKNAKHSPSIKLCHLFRCHVMCSYIGAMRVYVNVHVKRKEVESIII